MAFSGIYGVEVKAPGDSRWRDLGLATIELVIHYPPKVDPGLVIEAIEYTYQARCRRV